MRPYIVVVNDDGICSEGLLAAVKGAAAVGDVLVAAPVTQQTAMGRSYPRIPDLGIVEEVPDFIQADDAELGAVKDRVKAYAVHGSPGYCALFGILELSERRPDLLVSGINIGLNAGKCLTTSGTLGAAFEARSQEVPALALSLEVEEETVLEETAGLERFRCASAITEYWVRRVLEEKDGDHPEYQFLNVNIPSGEIGTDDYRFTFLEDQNYYVQEPIPKGRDRKEPFVPGWRIRVDEAALHAGSDIQTVVQDRLTSVTPLTMDFTRNEKSRF